MIEAQKNELRDAQMAKAQSESKLHVAKQSHDSMVNQLAEEKTNAKRMEDKLKRITTGPSDMLMEGIDQEMAVLKYKIWQPKMTCGSCTDAGNDVEVFLPCGHVFCDFCVSELKKSRPTACPFCRRRFNNNDV